MGIVGLEKVGHQQRSKPFKGLNGLNCSCTFAKSQKSLKHTFFWHFWKILHSAFFKLQSTYQPQNLSTSHHYFFFIRFFLKSSFFVGTFFGVFLLPPKFIGHPLFFGVGWFNSSSLIFIISLILSTRYKHYENKTGARSPKTFTSFSVWRILICEGWKFLPTS